MCDDVNRTNVCVEKFTARDERFPGDLKVLQKAINMMESRKSEKSTLHQACLWRPVHQSESILKIKKKEKTTSSLALAVSAKDAEERQNLGAARAVRIIADDNHRKGTTSSIWTFCPITKQYAADTRLSDGKLLNGSSGHQLFIMVNV